MKLITTILMVSFFINLNVYSRESEGGESRAGNGGGAWVCQNRDQLQTIRWAKLVDLYEAEKEFFLPMKDFGDRDYQEIVDLMKMKLISINKKLYKKLVPHFEEVENNIKEVDADLDAIDDSLYRLRPPQRDCLGGDIEYVQLANYTHYGTILVNSYLFNSEKISETDKAALILHEVIYSYLRDRCRDKNSVRTRKIVGNLFSTLKDREISKNIDSIVGYISGEVSGMEFVKIIAGSFLIGSHISEPYRESNENQRLVTITSDFEMMTTEVTQSLYFKITGENPSYFKGPEYCTDSFQTTVSHITGKTVILCPNNPVERVSFIDVQKFIALLNVKTGGHFSLPTEAQWEYAARAGTTTAYSFGNSSRLLSDYAINSRNSMGQTQPVGPMRNHSNRPNGNGLYDMHGNVEEWTQDRYTRHPFGRFDPVGPAGGRGRVVRGNGNWLYRYEAMFRSAHRQSFLEELSDWTTGFRLIRNL